MHKNYFEQSLFRFPALLEIRERNLDARLQQNLQSDSGHGTSANDSESEPDSILNLPQNEAVDGRTSEGSNSSLDEGNEVVPGNRKNCYRRK